MSVIQEKLYGSNSAPAERAHTVFYTTRADQTTALSVCASQAQHSFMII